jgi:hypothetical protein
MLSDSVDFLIDCKVPCSTVKDLLKSLHGFAFIQASHFSIFFFSVFAAFSKESKYELDKQVMDYVQQFQFLYKEKRDVYQKEVHY